jgi:hypothetical protein
MDSKNITMQQMRELVARESWVKTPFKYTQLGAGLSLIQQQALLMVSEVLQSFIKDFYNMHLDKAKNRPKALFSEHVLRDGLPTMKIYLADLGVNPSNYNAAREAIEQINLKVEHPEFDQYGNPTGRTLLTNVFSQFGFEDTGDYYHFEDKEGEKQAVMRKQPYIDVKINPDVAEWAFDMSQGYVNHLKKIASYSTKRPTPRLYLMLMNRTKKGERTVRILLTELKEYLGIVPYKDERTGEMIVPYPKFANFRQKVLDAVKADLDRMANTDPQTTDITFTYELLYPGTRKKGDPEAILFHVERTALGTAYNVVVNHAKMPQPVQQELFATVPEASASGLTSEHPRRDYDAGAGADLWAQLLADYDGAAKSLLARAKYLGLRGGSFYVSISKADDDQWDALDKEWNSVYAVARPLLNIPRLAPAIVKTVQGG